MSNDNTFDPTKLVDGLDLPDKEAAFNMRDWLQKACEAKGAKMVGGRQPWRYFGSPCSRRALSRRENQSHEQPH